MPIVVKSSGPLFDGTAPVRLTTSVRSWLQGSLRTVRDYARDAAPQDTGQFRRSIIYRTRQAGARVSGEIYSTLDPALVNTIEYGRRAGAKMPPAGALLGWMGRKGIDASQEFVIRRGIARRGIPARSPFGKAFARYQGLFASQRRVLAAELVRGLQ